MNIAQPSHEGYLRMPNSWLLLEISPGAKVLLAHFCSMANETGDSWCSYAQMTKIVGRGKSSISAYVAELRKVGMIRTKEQKTANGYNYRLLITVVAWKELVQKWTKSRRLETNSANQKNEHRVQSTERKDPKGPINKTYKTKPPANPFLKTVTGSFTSAEQTLPVGEWSNQDEKAWKTFRPSDKDPASEFGDLPDPTLVAKMEQRLTSLKAIAGILEASGKRSLINGMTDTFCSEKKIQHDLEGRSSFVQTMMDICKTRSEILSIFEALSGQWHPSWRRLSTEGQIKAVYNSLPAMTDTNSRSILAEIGKINTRLMMYRMALKRSAPGQIGRRA